MGALGTLLGGGSPNGVDFDTLKSAVGGLDLAKLESMKTMGVKK